MNQTIQAIDGKSRVHSGVPVIPPLADRNDRPLISVVTASFNARDDLKFTVRSVAEQTCRDVEHVVIDGGSTDGTKEYLQSLSDMVRWISEPDDGIGDAMNKGVAMATGEWIIVLQAGDTFDSETSLSTGVEQLSVDLDVLSCGIRFGGATEDRVMLYSDPLRRLSFKAILHQGSICRRTLFERIGGFDGSYRIGMDYEFFLRARQAGARFKTVSLILARMDDGGVSSQKDWPSLSKRFAEERRAQLEYCPSLWMRMVYAAYWPSYLAYRRLRTVLAKS